MYKNKVRRVKAAPLSCSSELRNQKLASEIIATDQICQYEFGLY